MKQNKFENVFSKYETLTDIEIDEYKEEFNSFDKNGNGFIEIKELRAVLNDLGENLSDEEIHKLIDKVDLDKNGKIDFCEFINLINSTKVKTENSNLVSALEAFMQEDIYYTNSNEIKYFLLNSNLDLNEDEIDDLIDEIYIKEDGTINYPKLYELFNTKAAKKYINAI